VIVELHFPLTSTPVTGKLKITIRVGFTINRMGLFKGGKIQVIIRENLIGKDIGLTLPRVKVIRLYFPTSSLNELQTVIHLIVV